MSGNDLFMGLNQIDPKFVEEAETVTNLKGDRKKLSLRRPLQLAAVFTLMLMLVGCGAVIYTILAEEPWASLPKVEGSQVSKDDIQITLTEVTPTYLTYHCDIDGFGTEEKQILFYTDSPCVIEKKVENGWERLPRKTEDPEWKADTILTDGHYDGKIHWAAHYGYLEAGSYRLSAQILEGHGDFVLEFEITAEMRSKGLELAEDLVNREFWHIRETYSREFGPLNNVPAEAKEQFTRPDESADDASEYWKCGEDYLYLMYDAEKIVHGMMFKDGIKYKLVREWESTEAPIVGWMPWPDMDLNRLTGWTYTLEDDRFERTVSHRDDGTLKTILLTGTEKTSFDVDVQYTTTLEVMETSREEIGKLLEGQNTNVWQEFSWAEDQKTQTPLEVAFVNTASNPISTAADALALAEKECSVDYTQVKIYRDEAAAVWKIEYQIMYGYQGYQFVYLNDDGQTVMISGSASKVEQWQTEYPGP